MRFLVTGINGFVGPYLAKLLIAEGHEVFGVCRTIQDERLEGMKYVAVDMRSINGFATIMLKSFNLDGVFHLAALTHPPTSFKKPAQYFENNAMGTVNLCEALEEGCVFMQCSTPEVYGICPEKEIFETFPMKPMNPYGVSKAAADLYILERTRNNAIKAFITRAGSHTGPGRPACYSISSDAIQIARILMGKQKPIIRVGNLLSQRAVIDVRDVVVAYYRLMLAYINGGITNGEIFHVSGHTSYTMEYYLHLMMDLFGVKAEFITDENLVRKIDIPVQILNSDKARNLIDWEPIIPIENTLRDLVNYWIQNEAI